MTSIRHFIAPAVLVLLGFAATPAHATLLIKSDGNGLFVQDKNNLDDNLDIGTGDHAGQPGQYKLSNTNGLDFDKFDTQVGCGGQSTNFDEDASCFRNGPQMNILLREGRDILSLRATNGLNGPVIFAAPVGESHVAGGPGNDILSGHAGVDHLNGGLGNDTLRGSLGNDDLDGAENVDRLEGGDGNDTLRGEGNADTLIGDKGADVLRGGAGNDFINSREPEGSTSVADGVDCGNGFDTVEADLKDNVQADCNEVDRAPVGETPNVDIAAKTLAVSSSGRVRVRLRCPRGVGSLGCNGRLQLKVGGAQVARSRRVRYRIRAGRRKTVTLTLTRADVRKLRGKRRRGVLTSVEKGRKGPKTTIRNPRLRLR